jgi:hypothetical protein
MNVEESISSIYGSWEPVSEAFLEWLGGRENILEPGLIPEPTIKVLAFLALLESDKACTYDDIREIFRKKTVIKGNIPDNTLRTSVLNLGKTLEKFGHPLELRSFRGRFQLVTRIKKPEFESSNPRKKVLLLDDSIINAIEIAKIFVEKSMIPFNALYFLEWSARCWEIYSRNEAETRVPYEVGALEQLGTKERLFKSHNADSPLSIVSLGPSEGLAEIALLKKLFSYDNNNKIHYLAIDSSPRLLRNHIGLLKETLTEEIENGRLLCVGMVADIFSNLRETIRKARNEFKNCGTIQSDNGFIPSSSSLLVTYFGNCLGNDGNNAPEVGFFSMIHSIFPNRPIEILVGVSVMRSQPDEYKRNWDDFLLQTPKHLLQTSKLFESSREEGSNELSEFTLPHKKDDNVRCPPVIPEPYLARHQIEGQIYRFYYKLAFDLKLNKCLSQEFRQLPKGTLILLYNIIKYNMRALVSGIEKIGLFKVKYDPNYHQLVKTTNGEREYAVFSAYIEE